MKRNEVYLSTETSVNNVFIEFTHLRNLKSYINSSTKFYMSNISNKNTEILTFLRKYVKSDKKREYTDKKNREGYVFDVMLPLDVSISDDMKIIKQYVRSFIRDVTEGNMMHYFVTLVTIGKARILRVIILNRVIYPEGKEVEYTRSQKLFTKTVYVSTKIRLNPFATKNSNSNKVFVEKLKHLKLMLLKSFNKEIKRVKHFFKKLTYKKIYYAEAINEYYYVESTLDQRSLVAELKKRRITIINLLIERLNLYINKSDENADIEAFTNKWANILYSLKQRKLSEINAIEEEILLKIETLKIFKI